MSAIPPVPPVATPAFTSPTFTPDQWRTLFALTSTVVPPISLPGSTSNTAIARYAASTANADNVAFRKGLEQTFETRIPAHSKKGIATILDMLNSTIGCLLLTYSKTPFHEQPIEERERILKTWTAPTSYLLFPPIRGFGISIVKLTKVLWIRKVSGDIYPAISYDGGAGRVNAWTKDDSWKETPEPKKGEECGFYNAWDFIQITEPTELEADVVIVGSGCGGAVVAKRAAEAGLRVIVVEKGVWVPTDQLPLSDDEASDRTFERGLISTTEDGSVAFMAGATFGGGGSVNWSASLQPPHYVRKEWAEERRLPFFQTPDFQRHLDAVCERMGVSIPTHHNHRNNALLAGAHKLGYLGVAVPQNASPDHQDAFCTYGCGHPPHARKNGPVHSWLPDASRAGARFITEFHAKSLLFSHANEKQVVGVSGVYGSQEIPVVIKAKEVVVSAGSLNTPVFLLNSGLMNTHIGANLHVHPAACIHAIFPESREPAIGASLTSMVNSFDNLDGKGHGVRLQTPVMVPAMMLGNLHWGGGEEWKKDVLKYQRTDSYFGLVRDEQTGRVEVDSNGRPRIKYTPGPKERDWLLTGIEALAKIALVEGAEKIWSPVFGFPPFVRQKSDGPNLGILDPAFQEWLKQLRTVGFSSPATSIISAHQMGSCRMGASADEGVVDVHGRVFRHEGLTVADASIMPSACGVNPMVTTMAIASWVGENLVKRFREKSAV